MNVTKAGFALDRKNKGDFAKENVGKSGNEPDQTGGKSMPGIRTPRLKGLRL